MPKKAFTSSSSEPRLSLSQLRRIYDEWALDCQLKQFSAKTLDCRKVMLAKFFWFLESRSYSEVGAAEIKYFLGYLATGHTEPGGRWGNPRLTKPMRPVSVRTYYRALHAFCAWMVEEDVIEVSLMGRVKAPIYRIEVKQPVPREALQALFEAAKTSKAPDRNEAILLLLLDTGVRASELCNAKMKDIDLTQRTLRVLGKGNKFRTCYLGREATKALMKYLRTHPKEPEQPLFAGEGGRTTGEQLTASGLFQLLKRLSKAAGIPVYGPHALRRTFAVEFLRASNGNVFTCQHLLGHTDLTQTRLYCAVAQADIENQHRQFSPADHIKRR